MLRVHFSWRLLGREPKSAEQLLVVYGALLATGTDLQSRGVATMMRGVSENAVRGYMRLFEAEPAIRAGQRRDRPLRPQPCGLEPLGHRITKARKYFGLRQQRAFLSAAWRTGVFSS